MNQHGHMDRALPGLTPGVKLLIAINLIGFVIKNLVFVSSQGAVSDFVGFSWSGIGDGYGLGLLRAVSYQFFHSVNIGHILWNLLFLYFFGTMVEGRSDEGYANSYLWLGRRGIIHLYLVSGVVGGFAYVLMSAVFGRPAVPVIGASGAVYGIMLYAACVNPRRVINFVFISIELRYLVGILVFMGVYMSYLTLATGADSGVADSAHLGGALWGYIAYRLTRGGISLSERGPLAWWRRRRQAGAVRAAQRQQETLDQLLDKVHAQGMSALTAAERRFLEGVSKNARK